MSWRGLSIALAAAGLLAACQMPQPQSGIPIPSGPSIPSGSSSPASMPSPSGSPSPAGSSGSQSPAGSSSPSGSSGSAGSPGSEMPPGSSEGADAGGADSPSGPTSPGGGAEAAGGVEPMGGASVPWPEQPGGSGDVGDLDEQLDESLGDFDETVLAGGGAPVEQEIDILDPVGDGSAGTPGGNQPIFEEGDLDEEGAAGDGAYENVEVAQRAEAGGGGGAAGGGTAGSAKAAGGAASGGGGGAAATSGTERGGAGSSGAEDGAADDVPIPEDVGDGRNDDIVLRQIRDAASKETDPVLREKLWDEYRRIRAQK